MTPDQSSEEQIFEAAFALHSDEARNEYLQQICRDDEQVERIQALLKAGAPEDSFLETGPAAVKADDHVSADLPERIGDFEILSELGRGGMGVVYRARQCSLNRLVALKVLSAGLGLTTRAIMRFKLEAEAAAKLHHTNIVPIYWTGEEKRVPYFAMELIDGPSLDRVIKQLRAQSSGENAGPADSRDQHVPDWIRETLISSTPPTDETTSSTDTSTFDSSTSLGSDSTYYDNLARMMAEVADALAHAHNHGIVHRDIKPANLLLSSDGRLSINDFGLARMLEQPGMTMTGELMGSPMYMSPEQITAGRLPLDYRTDIYSLGATLYEMLTLQPPFPGQQRDQVLSQVIHKDPAKPRSINPRIPRDLETICMKAMEKDPDRRYQTAELLAEDLRRFVNRHAISARRVSLVEKGIRWVRKNKAISAMVCLVLALVVGGASFFIHQEKKREADAREQQRKQEAEQLEQDKQQAIADALMSAELGRFDEAIVKISEAEKLGLEKWRVNMLLGLAHSEAGNAGESLAAFLKAEEGNPDSLAVECMVATAHLQNANWKEYDQRAEAIRNRTIDLKMLAPEELRYLSQIYLFYDDRKALECLDIAIEKQPAFLLARIRRAEVKSQDALNRSDTKVAKEAISELEALQILHPELAGNSVYRSQKMHSRLALVSLYQQNGQEELAETTLRLVKDDFQDIESNNMVVDHFWRMYYYEFLWNRDGDENFLDKMGDVMEDYVRIGGNGFVVDGYWTTYYVVGGNRIAQALRQLEAIKVQDGYPLWGRLVLLMELSRNDPARKDAAQKLLEKMQNNELVFADYAQLFLGDMSTVPTDVRKYLNGDVEDDELKSLVQRLNSERIRLKVYFARGLQHLARGNRPKALEFFEDIEDSCYFHWSQRPFAKAFAARLRKNDGWPHWLPAESIDHDKAVKDDPD